MQLSYLYKNTNKVLKVLFIKVLLKKPIYRPKALYHGHLKPALCMAKGGCMIKFMQNIKYQIFKKTIF